MKINLSEQYNKGLERIKNQIIRSQQQLGLTDSGRSASSITISDNQLEMTGYIATNFDSVGRRPGTFPPVDAIMRWGKLQVSEGQTREQAAYMVGKALSEKGSLIYRGKTGIPFDSIIIVNAKRIARGGGEKIAADFSEELNKVIVSK